MKAVILAGGGGTRLWPMSRQDRPKQFFSLISEEPLIRDTYRRLLRWFSAEDIYFAVTPDVVSLLREAFPELDESRVIIDPAKRDTGPAMGYVAAILELSSPDESMVFIPSDHWIGDEELYVRCFQVGDDLIQKTGKLLDIAIAPTFTSTIVGYTKIGELHQETADGIKVYNFAGHVEKPDYETAKSFLEEGSYLWHANYYMWTPALMMQALDKYTPAIGRALREIQVLLKSGEREGITEVFEAMPAISIDYAMTEKMATSDMLIIKGEFGWNDVGAWDTIHDQFKPEVDGDQNVTRGRVVTVDAQNNLLYAHSERMIAAVGVSELVVVDAGDAILVCPKKDSQRIKELVAEIKKLGYKDIL